MATGSLVLGLNWKSAAKVLLSVKTKEDIGTYIPKVLHISTY